MRVGKRKPLERCRGVPDGALAGSEGDGLNLYSVLSTAPDFD